MLNDKIRNWLTIRIKPTARERWQTGAATVATVLFGLGLTQDHAALWGRLAVATVALLFAWLYATTPRNAAMYLLIAAIGGLLNGYGIAAHIDWMLIVGAAGQTLGVVTAAKNVKPVADIADPALQ